MLRFSSSRTFYVGFVQKPCAHWIGSSLSLLLCNVGNWTCVTGKFN